MNFVTEMLQLCDKVEKRPKWRYIKIVCSLSLETPKASYLKQEGLHLKKEKRMMQIGISLKQQEILTKKASHRNLQDDSEPSP